MTALNDMFEKEETRPWWKRQVIAIVTTIAVAAIEKTYGALATVIVFMTWLWISNLTLLIGAEVNDALAELRKDKDPAAAKLAEAEKPSNVKSPKGPSPQPA